MENSNKKQGEIQKGLNNVSRKSIYILICTHNSDGLYEIPTGKRRNQFQSHILTTYTFQTKTKINNIIF